MKSSLALLTAINPTSERQQPSDRAEVPGPATLEWGVDAPIRPVGFSGILTRTMQKAAAALPVTEINHSAPQLNHAQTAVIGDITELVANARRLLETTGMGGDFVSDDHAAELLIDIRTKLTDFRKAFPNTPAAEFAGALRGQIGTSEGRIAHTGPAGMPGAEILDRLINLLEMAGVKVPAMPRPVAADASLLPQPANTPDGEARRAANSIVDDRTKPPNIAFSSPKAEVTGLDTENQVAPLLPQRSAKGDVPTESPRPNQLRDLLIEQPPQDGSTSKAPAPVQKIATMGPQPFPTPDPGKAIAHEIGQQMHQPAVTQTSTTEPRSIAIVEPSAVSQSTTSAPPAYVFARNIAAQIRGRVFEDGRTRIELAPRGLGDIEIEVARDDAGKLRIVLRADNPAVLTAFRNDRDVITNVLREGGLSVDGGDLEFEEFDRQKSNQHYEGETSASPMDQGDHRLDIAPSPGSDAPQQTQSKNGLNIIT